MFCSMKSSTELYMIITTDMTKIMDTIQLLNSSSYILCYKTDMLTLPIVSELLVTIYTAVLCASLTELVNVLKCSPGNLLHHLPYHLWEVIVVAPPPVLSGTTVVQFLRPCVSWNGNRLGQYLGN